MYLGYFQKYVNHAPPLLLCPPVSPRINCLFNLSLLNCLLGQLPLHAGDELALTVSAYALLDRAAFFLSGPAALSGRALDHEDRKSVV